MSEGTALEPSLSRLDLHVLCVIPALSDHLGSQERHTLWQIGEALNAVNLADVVLTLNGLTHLGYALVQHRRGHPPVWWRTRKGDGLVSIAPGPARMRAQRAPVVARRFHEVYEDLAPEHGYETRRESRVSWARVPKTNRKLMIATVERLLEEGTIR